ncbi:hypothetical protein RQP46_007985 [Phenoliferia psychrophenolica]
MSPATRFYTERLVFRAFEDATDVATIQRIFSDPGSLTSYTCSLPTPLTAARAAELAWVGRPCLAKIVICLPLSEEAQTLAGEAIGWLYLMGPGEAFQQHHRAEFGIALAKEYQGRGYGPEALRWLLDLAFVGFNLHKVTGDVWAWNTAARALYKKLGFVEEGVRRENVWQDGEWRDEVQLGILSREWLAKRKELI